MNIKKTISYILLSAILIMAMSSCSLGKTGSNNSLVMRNEFLFANSQGAYDTEKYIYVFSKLSGGLTRHNKVTKSEELISENAEKIPALVTDNEVYYVASETGSYALYKISDEESEPEMLYELAADSIYFINGKYIYSVSKGGAVTRYVNSESKFKDSAEVIHARTYGVRDVEMYKNYIYYISGTGGEFVRVSLDDGTAETIAENLRIASSKTTKYYFTGEHGDKIVYVTDDGRLFSCDLDGGNKIEYPEKADNIYVVDNYIYFNKSMKNYRIPVGNSDPNAIDAEHGYFCSYDSNAIDNLSDIGNGIYVSRANKIVGYDSENTGW